MEPMVANTRKPHEARLITAAPEWWKAFDHAAEEKDQTLSAWLAEAGRRYLPTDIRNSLPPPVKRGRPKKS